MGDPADEGLEGDAPKPSIKRMDIREFRELGFLQEANRRFFHPLGLALEVQPPDADSDDQTWRLSGIWDYRDDPEGIFFEFDDAELEEARRREDAVFAELRKHKAARTKLLGSIIQPISRRP